MKLLGGKTLFPGWRARAEIFRTMPLGSTALFLLAIACLFAAIGAVVDSMNAEISTPWTFAYSTLMTAFMAILWALSGTRRMLKLFALTIVLQFLVVNSITKAVYSHPPHALTVRELQNHLRLHGAVTTLCIVAAYSLFLAFFRKEGKRFFAAHTEIQLASAIQSQLVPTIQFKSTTFEFYGISVPSGTVGGDLLDVVTTKDRFFAYIADVSGHGVPAGVLMSMVKSAVRMRVCTLGPSDDGILSSLNEVLQPLTTTNTYATFAYVASAGDGLLRFSLAEHLPILHYRNVNRSVERCTVENFPIGMLPKVGFDSATVAYEPGDVFAMVTDGLTEIFDRQGRELGMQHIEEALADSPGKPLPETARVIMNRSQSFGPITDDRTLLLVRCLA
ncbi:MAG: serine/threonine-protein phosphatase [Acidobacteriaceae bacterium]|nr:serine/threonine-protein phosphatase [Acidobacteriaceae bacterium]